VERELQSMVRSKFIIRVPDLNVTKNNTTTGPVNSTGAPLTSAAAAAANKKKAAASAAAAAAKKKATATAKKRKRGAAAAEDEDEATEKSMMNEKEPKKKKARKGNNKKVVDEDDEDASAAAAAAATSNDDDGEMQYTFPDDNIDMSHPLHQPASLAANSANSHSANSHMNDESVLDEANSDKVLYMVNYDQFYKIVRNELIVQYVQVKVNPTCANVIRLLLDNSTTFETTKYPDFSYYFSFDEILQHINRGVDSAMSASALRKYLDIMCKDPLSVMCKGSNMVKGETFSICK